MASKALVILSGGQDSTTCAAIAKTQFDEVHAVVFDYNQRHKTEIASARLVSEHLGLDTFSVINIADVLSSTSPLVSELPLGQYNSCEELPGGIEPTFIPARNILFLTIAANRAVCLDLRDIFIGVCETDFAGYWDCRDSFIKAMAVALGEGIYGVTDAFQIHTPLMFLSKSQSTLLAKEVLGKRFESVMELTHTCYAGIRGGCGKCHACLLRDRGFREAGLPDPIWRFRTNP